jgi:hypothetical protein
MKILENVDINEKNNWSAITKFCVLLNSDINTIISLQNKVDLSYLINTLKSTHNHLRDELAPFLLYHKIDEAPLYFKEKNLKRKHGAESTIYQIVTFQPIFLLART